MADVSAVVAIRIVAMTIECFDIGTIFGRTASQLHFSRQRNHRQDICQGDGNEMLRTRVTERPPGSDNRLKRVTHSRGPNDLSSRVRKCISCNLTVLRSAWVAASGPGAFTGQCRRGQHQVTYPHDPVLVALSAGVP